MATLFYFALVVAALIGLGDCECRKANWWNSFDKEGLSKCDAAHEYIRGFERNNNWGKGDGIFLLEEAECCSRVSPWVGKKTQTMYSDWWGVFDNNDIWARCPNGYFLHGLHRSGKSGGWLHNIEEGRCSKPADHPGYYGHCYDHDIMYCFDNKGVCRCNENYFVTGLYRGGCDKLYCLEKLRCCKMTDKPEPFEDVYQVKTRIMDTTMSDIALLAHYLGYGWCGGCRSKYVGEDFRKYGTTWVADKSGRCKGHKNNHRLKMVYGDWSFSLKDIVFGESVIDSLEPATIEAATIINNDPNESQESVSRTESSVRSVIHSTTSTSTLSHEIGATVSYVPPMATGGAGASMSYTFGFEDSMSTTDSTNKEQVNTLSVSSTKILPPYSRTSWRLVLSKTRTTVAYTATIIAKFSTKLEGFLRWGGGRNKRDTNYHHKHRGSKSRPTFDYTFGDKSTPFYKALERQDYTSSHPWLWHDMKNAHPKAESVIKDLCNEDRYVFIITGKFEDVVGTSLELQWNGSETMNRRKREVDLRNETVPHESVKHLKNVATAGPEDPPAPKVDPPVVHLKELSTVEYEPEPILGD